MSAPTTDPPASVAASPGALLEDEAKQQWIVPPSSSITGVAAASGPSDASSSTAPSGPAVDPSVSRRRQQNVSAFLKQGERNETFKVKAPSIFAQDYYSVAATAQPAHSAEPPFSAASSSFSSSASSSAAPATPGSGSGFRRLMANLSSRFKRRTKAAGGGEGEGEGEEEPLAADGTSKPRRKRRGLLGRITESKGGSDSGALGSSDVGSDDDDESDAPTALTHLEREAALIAARHAHQRGVLEAEDDSEQSNFSTVDWTRQDEKDMLQFYRLHEPLARPSSSSFSRGALTSGGRGCCGVLLSKVVWCFRVLMRLLAQAWRASQGWVLCGLVGIMTGLLASMVDMCVHWVIDFRLGICKDNIWLSNRSCCASVAPDNPSPNRDNNALQQVCPLWENWDVVLANWGISFGVLSDYTSANTRQQHRDHKARATNAEPRACIVANIALIVFAFSRSVCCSALHCSVCDTA